MELFGHMQSSEQAHSLLVFNQLLAQREMQEDLLGAALLHDVGKSRFPLRIWERVLIVLGKALVPERAADWGQGEPRGWKRPFVVAEKHPDWGAEMASAAGASPLAVSIIQRHQDVFDPAQRAHGGERSLEDQLLYKLQEIDNER
jgi:hypothetical protein